MSTRSAGPPVDALPDPEALMKAQRKRAKEEKEAAAAAAAETEAGTAKAAETTASAEASTSRAAEAIAKEAEARAKETAATYETLGTTAKETASEPKEAVENRSINASPEETGHEILEKDKDDNPNPQAGLTRNGDRIEGYIPQKFKENPHTKVREIVRCAYVVSQENQLNPLALQSMDEVGFAAHEAYQNLPQDKKRDLSGTSNLSYLDAAFFQEVIGFASNPFKKAVFSTRKPPGYGGYKFGDGNTTWNKYGNRTAFRKMLGKDKADGFIASFYSTRNLTPPWKEPRQKTKTSNIVGDNGVPVTELEREPTTEPATRERTVEIDGKFEAMLAKMKKLEGIIEDREAGNQGLATKMTEIEKILNKIANNMVVR